jgi:hypothetical protein
LRRRDLAWRVFAGQGVVVDLVAMTAYVLNDSGAALWQRLERGATTEELAALLVDRYKVEVSNVIGDLADWLGALAGRGWIEQLPLPVDVAAPEQRAYVKPLLERDKKR